MGLFEIVGSRRLGLEDCEFDVILQTGEIMAGEMFSIEERGTLWEYIVISIQPHAAMIALYCKPWLPDDGAFVGLEVACRTMKAIDRKRYARVLKDNPPLQISD